MKVSYNWLQDNFEGKLPPASDIKNELIMHAFEVESMDEIDVLNEKDYLFDIKILPNRAHDCNGHRGIAREVALIFNLPLKQPAISNVAVSADVSAVNVSINDTNLCPRYIGRAIHNIKIGDSPLWLKRRLASIGQKSINNIVDAANYVMFQTGQPLHIFDADKVLGRSIKVRSAREGEKMTTLDGKVLTLDPSMLVIADTDFALALAGIKGGMQAGTTSETKNIILESANFMASPIRKTSHKTGVRTDASFRFEHEIAPDLAKTGMDELTDLIIQIASGDDTKIGPVTDIYPSPRPAQHIGFSLSDIEAVLGITMDANLVEGLLDRLKKYANFDWKKSADLYEVSVPPERLDMISLHGEYSGGVREDIIEELGRINGYEKIPFVPLSVIPRGPVNKTLYYSELIRDVLVKEGFSEVYNYTIVGTGTAGQTIELRNPLNEEKRHLRQVLSEGLSNRLLFNVHNKDLLGIDQIRIFEIGRVFPSYDVNNEQTHCAIAIESLGKKYDIKKELDRLSEVLVKTIGASDLKLSLDIKDGVSGVLEFNISSLIESLPTPDDYPTDLYAPADAIYKAISPFPFVSRDIAVFVPVNTSGETVLSVIKENATNLLVKNKLFDQFTKKFEDGTQMTSYAFRLIFQSDERTLTGEEISAIMDKITNVLNGNEGWKVR